MMPRSFPYNYCLTSRRYGTLLGTQFYQVSMATLWSQSSILMPSVLCCWSDCIHGHTTAAIFCSADQDLPHLLWIADGVASYPGLDLSGWKIAHWCSIKLERYLCGSKQVECSGTHSDRLCYRPRESNVCWTSYNPYHEGEEAAR
jgi:hypothetical protein